MALAVSASLRDEQERARRLTESQLIELGLTDQLEEERSSGVAVPPEPPGPCVDGESAELSGRMLAQAVPGEKSGVAAPTGLPVTAQTRSSGTVLAKRR